MTPEDRLQAQVNEAIASGDIIVCLTRCWPCMLNSHESPPRWHPWADDEDIEHAAATGRPDPSGQRCGCTCAETATS